MAVRLKELRKEKKYTQAQIAELMGVNVKTISRWEKGEFEIKPAQAKMLADYFGVSETYLLGYSSIKNEDDIKVSVLDETLKKLHVIKDNMILRESDEGPNLLDLGLVTAIAAIESFKKEIEGQKDEQN
ncbi:putative transcriptional regulator [Streptococcus infantarius subsp. infantarius]|nr:putative transcriptional regulator [Streptococcus infantarius subsp. infantarius]